MMGGGWLAGDGGPVDDLAGARDRAEDYAATLAPDLRVGEVMRFTDNFYAELEEPDGTLATEVLIEPRTGAVQLEFGPRLLPMGSLADLLWFASLDRLGVRISIRQFVTVGALVTVPSLAVSLAMLAALSG